jgi:hypothetical protein
MARSSKRPFCPGYNPHKLTRFGIDPTELDTLFISERDGQPIKIHDCWTILPAVAREMRMPAWLTLFHFVHNVGLQRIRQRPNALNVADRLIQY